MEREEILRLAVAVAYRVARTVDKEAPPSGEIKELLGTLRVDEAEATRWRDDLARNLEPGLEEYVVLSDRFFAALASHPEVVGPARSFVESWDRRTAASAGTPGNTGRGQYHATSPPLSSGDGGPLETELVGMAARQIGKMALSSGELSDAEYWLRVAVLSNHAPALNDLAFALAKLGREREAQKLWIQMYEAGDQYAAGNLAMICERKRNFDKAEFWWRKAEERGLPEAAVWLGLRLYHRGEQVEAEARWRSGVQADMNTARELLGALMAEQNEMEAARELLWDPAEAGRPAAMWNLARICAAVGEPARALVWARRAAASGLDAALEFLNRRTRAERDPSNEYVFMSSGPNTILIEFGRNLLMISAPYVPISCTNGMAAQTRSAKFENGLWQAAPLAKRRWWLLGR